MIAIVLAIYMVVITRRFRDVSFFVNYFCYNISAIYLILLAPLLLGILLHSYFDSNWFIVIERIISKELSVLWLAVGFVCSLYLLWLWLIMYLYVVHPCPDFPQDIRHQCLWFGLRNCTVLEYVSDSVFVFLRPRYNRRVDVKLAMSRHGMTWEIARWTASSLT